MKYGCIKREFGIYESPLVRGEWIEMDKTKDETEDAASPLVRGEWIEIYPFLRRMIQWRSPLVRGEWIEITQTRQDFSKSQVSPRERGVD